MNSDMPVYLKYMVKVPVNLIESTLITKRIADEELRNGYEFLSGFFLNTMPDSPASFAGYYTRQYIDAFWVLPAQGENYDSSNISPYPY